MRKQEGIKKKMMVARSPLPKGIGIFSHVFHHHLFLNAFFFGGII